MAHKMHVRLRKVWMKECKHRKCYMHLKFHINTPYIVSVINFILTHTLSFFSVSTDKLYSETIKHKFQSSITLREDFGVDEKKLPSKAKEKYRGMFEIQKSGDKTSSGEIGLDIRTHESPKVGQDQVFGCECAM